MAPQAVLDGLHRQSKEAIPDPAGMQALNHRGRIEIGPVVEVGVGGPAMISPALTGRQNEHSSSPHVRFLDVPTNRGRSGIGPERVIRDIVQQRPLNGGYLSISTSAAT
jgi:hypothetical protein